MKKTFLILSVFYLLVILLVLLSGSETWCTHTSGGHSGAKTCHNSSFSEEIRE